MNILANDGISNSGLMALKEAGHTVYTDFVEANELEHFINENEIDGILVRSATKVRKELMDACPTLKFVGRGGVGMDNIDVEYGREKGLKIFNTPAASSQSVAELVMGHLFSLSRSLHHSNRSMPENGIEDFKVLKKQYSKGTELRGKTLGIIGMGRIGSAVARRARGFGLTIHYHNRNRIQEELESSLEATYWESLDQMLAHMDIIVVTCPSTPATYHRTSDSPW